MKTCPNSAIITESTMAKAVVVLLEYVWNSINQHRITLDRKTHFILHLIFTLTEE